MFDRTKRAAIVSCAALLAFATPMALAGCDSGDATDASTGSTPMEASGQKEQVKSDYAVSIDNCTVTSDYEGAPAIVVDYTFTNNSDKDASFAVACTAKAFQNGAELETAIVSEDLGNGYMAEVKPGATTQARLAYKLADQSEVSVEVEELFSLEEAKIAEKTFSVA